MELGKRIPALNSGIIDIFDNNISFMLEFVSFGIYTKTKDYIRSDLELILINVIDKVEKDFYN